MSTPSDTPSGIPRRLRDDLLAASRFIVGPTASGKSTVAMHLADRLNAEIIALDSRTIYRGFDIGTAKPSADDQAAVRHHLVDVADATDAFNAADYIVQAVAAAADIVARGRTPLFVGGAGMYLRSLLRGVFDGPPSDPANRAAIEAELDRVGVAAMHGKLAAIDPVAAARIAVRDRQRVVRALEVFQTSGRRFSDWHTQPTFRPGAHAIWLDRPRSELHDRINDRVLQMIADGWTDEVRRLLDRKPPAGSVFWKNLGYPQLADVLCGRRTLPDAVTEIQTLTRQFAKRQVTWFRGLDEVTAVPVDQSDSLDAAAARVSATLESGGVGPSSDRRSR